MSNLLQRLRKDWLNVLLLSAGVVFIALVQLQRTPGLFNGLWTDEVCYNQGYLSVQGGLHALSKAVCIFFKPVVDFSLKKWFWFKLFSASEVGFSLVPWFYAGLTLLLILFTPWTPFIELRLLGVLLVGTCSLEELFSADAEGYSLSSLMGWVSFLCLGWSLRQLSKRFFNRSFWIFLLGLAVGLNGHFFAWPYLGAIALLYSALFLQAIPSDQKRQWGVRLITGVAVVFGVSLIVNSYPLINMVVNAPASNEQFVLKWKPTWDHIQTFYRYAGIPLAMYIVISFAGFAHPKKEQRALSLASFIAAGPALYFLVLMFFARSSYTIQDRYLISYLAPVFLFFLLGAESITLRIARFHNGMGRMVALMSVLAIGILFKSSLKAYPAEAQRGWHMLKEKPLNYSTRSEFFEKVKSFQKSTLVLTNQCWLTTIPNLYMRYVGNKLPDQAECLVYGVVGCETPETTLTRGINRFLNQYDKDGLVLFYFENNGRTPMPCNEPIPQAYRSYNVEEGCYALYEARTISAWLNKNYVNPNLLTAEEPDNGKSQFFKNTVAPIVFYLAPSFLLLLLFFVTKSKVKGE